MVAAAPRCSTAGLSLPAIGEAFAKLDPRRLARNPVMFVVAVVAALTTLLFLRDLLTAADHIGFSFQIILWLWFTVLFANFAEAIAEGRGKAQAESLRKTKEELKAKLYIDEPGGVWIPVSAQGLVPGNVVFVEAGDLIPFRRRGDRRRRLGQRGGDHGEVRARSSANRAATARPSPAALLSSPTGSR